MNFKSLLPITAACLAVCHAAARGGGRGTRLERAQAALAAIEKAETFGRFEAIAKLAYEKFSALEKISWAIEGGRDASDDAIEEFKEALSCASQDSMREAYETIALVLNAGPGESLEKAADRIERTHPKFDKVVESVSTYLESVVWWKKKYSEFVASKRPLVEEEEEQSLQSSLETIIALCKEELEGIEEKIGEMNGVAQLLVNVAFGGEKTRPVNSSLVEGPALAKGGASSAELYSTYASVSKMIADVDASLFEGPSAGSVIAASKGFAKVYEAIELAMEGSDGILYEQLGAKSIHGFGQGAAQLDPSSENFDKALDSVSVYMQALEHWKAKLTSICEKLATFVTQGTGQVLEDATEARRNFRLKLNMASLGIGPRLENVKAAYSTLVAKAMQA